MPWYLIFIYIIQVLVSIGLIVAVVSQTTKHEGLGGTIGGRAQASFRGRPGLEENIQRITMYLAIGWMGLCVLSFIVSHKSGF
jgi:preprotein translocase subunit SecG